MDENDPVVYKGEKRVNKVQDKYWKGVFKQLKIAQNNKLDDDISE